MKKKYNGPIVGIVGDEYDNLVRTSHCHSSRTTMHHMAREMTKKEAQLNRSREKTAQIKEQVRLYQEGKLGDDLTDTKVLGWDSTLNINTVLTVGDLATKDFYVDPDTQKVVLTNSEDSSVLEEDYDTGRVLLNVRRMDQRIVYTIAGTGIPASLGTPPITDFTKPYCLMPEGTLIDQHRPQTVVSIPMRGSFNPTSGTEIQGLESSIYAEVRPDGSVWIFNAYGTPANQATPINVACTATHIIHIQNTNDEQIIEGQYVKVNCKLQEDLIVYTASGKNTNTDITPNTDTNPYYVEVLPSQGLRQFSPHTRGPVIALRVKDEANTSAYLTFMVSDTTGSDGKIDYSKGYVTLTCKSYDPVNVPKVNILDNAAVTSAFLDTYVDKKLEYVAVGPYGTFNIKMDDPDGNVIIACFNPSINTGTGGTYPTIPGNDRIVLFGAGAVPKEYLPDKRITLDLMTEGCYIEIMPPEQEGLVSIVNTSSQTQTLSQENSTSVTHINKQDGSDTIENTINHIAVDVVLRKNDADICVQASAKASVPTIQSGTTVIASPGQIDPAFRPEGDDTIVVPLNTTGTAGQDNVLVIKSDGSAELQMTATSIVPGPVYSTAFEKGDEGEEVREVYETAGLSIDASIDGDVITYEVKAKSDSLSQGDQIPAGTFSNQALIPARDIVLTLPTDQESASSPAIVKIFGSESGATDAGKISVIQQGSGLDTEAKATENTVAADAGARTETATYTLTNGTLVCSKVNETIIYETEFATQPATGDSVAQGTITDSKFIPDEDVVVECPSNDGKKSIFINIAASNGAVTSTCAASVAPLMGEFSTSLNVNETVNTDKTEITVSEEQNYLDENGNMVNGIVDVLKFTGRLVGQHIRWRMKGFNKKLTSGWEGVPGKTGWFQRFLCSAGAIPKKFRPGKGKEAVIPVSTTATESANALEVMPRPMYCKVLPDGSAKMVTMKEMFKSYFVNPKPRQLCAISFRPELISGQKLWAGPGVLTEEMSIARRMRRDPQALPKWLQIAFRKIKNVVCAYVKGKGGINQTVNLFGQPLEIGLDPDMNFSAKVNPGVGKGSGSLNVKTDGSVQLAVNAGGLNMDVTKKFTLPYCNPSVNDDSGVLPQLYHQLPEGQRHLALQDHVLEMDSEGVYGVAGDAHYWDIELTPRLTAPGIEHKIMEHSLSCIYTRGGLVEVQGKIWNWIKKTAKTIASKIDFRTVLKKGLKAVGKFVTGVVSGNGFVRSGIDAAKEFVSGGLGQFVKPNKPTAIPQKTKDGKEAAFSVADQNGQMTTSSKPGVADPDQKTAAGFIAINATGSTTGVTSTREYYGYYRGLRVEDYYGYRITGEAVDIEIIRNQSVITYNVVGRSNGISTGETVLKQRVPSGLTPRVPLSQYINPTTTLTIDVDGTITLKATKECSLANNMVIPMVSLILPIGFKFETA